MRVADHEKQLQKEDPNNLSASNLDLCQSLDAIPIMGDTLFFTNFR